jgi:hypothetical protein
VKALVVISALLLASTSYAQSSGKPEKGSAAEIGSGVGTAAGGVAKGAGSAAAGVGKGAVDLATLHPIDAGAAAGTGAVKAGKDVTVGSAKGVGKIGKGIGHALRKIL